MIFSSLPWLLHVHNAVNRSCLIMYAKIAERTKDDRYCQLKRSPENFDVAVSKNNTIVLSLT